MLIFLLACTGSGDDGPGCEKETYWIDADKDGYGDPEQPFQACALANGLANNPDDCDDTRVEVRPGATEDDCTDPVDYNCDGSVGYTDADGDGSAACLDCDDSDADIGPDATEICNGKDDDCDGLVDWFAVDMETFYPDEDDDGYGDPEGETTEGCDAPEGYADNPDDCDDGDSKVHPGADEHCDGVDEDCDGVYDDNAEDAPAWYVDADSDGYGAGDPTRQCDAPPGHASSSDDCDDSDETQFPGADEVCNDEDDDCDGVVDDANRVPTDHASIQDALDAASKGDLVCVEAGTYKEVLDFDGKAVRLHSTEGSDNTVLSGPGGDSVVYLVGADAELVGFTIQGGDAAFGAGVYVYGGDPHLEDLVITDNSCDESTCYGTGIYLGYSAATLSNLRIVDNVADGDTIWGAGLSCEQCSLDAENVWISGNEAIGSSYVTSSGMSLSSSDSSVFDGLVVAGNTAETTTLYSAGIWVYSGGTTAFFNASVVGNLGIYASAYGEGITAYSSSSPSATNVDVSGHEIGWASLYSSSPSMTYSNAYNETDDPDTTEIDGTNGNISTEPGYTDTSGADAGSWDLSLRSASDLIDAGDPSRSDTDGSVSDIGAYGGPNGDGW
ncbi:MAG TPA: putative metal-binding motif-containing protein [Myxococcota bacterium]|nr:putative metal-binding motif-containing protein [Myxococcota bacterium]